MAAATTRTAAATATRPHRPRPHPRRRRRPSSPSSSSSEEDEDEDDAEYAEKEEVTKEKEAVKAAPSLPSAARLSTQPAIVRRLADALVDWSDTASATEQLLIPLSHDSTPPSTASHLSSSRATTRRCSPSSNARHRSRSCSHSGG